MTLDGIVQIVNIGWLLSEVGLTLFTWRNRHNTLSRDRGSRTLLWCVIGVGIAAGTAAQAVSFARIPVPEPWLLGVSLALLVGGFAVRWTAILTLGRLFSTSVAIHQDHRLVRTGLFRLVRHPSYSGLLLLMLGMALSLGNWLSVVVVVVPFLAVLLYRIRVEEASLVEALGQDYVEYCRSTKRLLPGVFCVGLLPVTFLGAGCATPSLMPTPNLYGRTTDNPFASVPPVFRTNTVEVLYATDRAPDGDPAKDPEYGPRRSLSLAFGMTTVCIGAGSWDDLVSVSRSAERQRSVPMSTLSTREVGRFPSVPTREVEHQGQWVESPESVDARRVAEARLKALVAERLALTPKKEVYVFIHGVGSDFPTPTYVMAGLWHFMGRCGVPVVYTWPSSGSGDSLGGYDYNRESSEFTVYHLKQFLRLLAACPGIEKIHILAHSRGTDTALAALRELSIEIRASGGDTRKVLKLGCVVLAAADMDLEVSTQRVSAERLMQVPEQMVLYVSPTDLRLRLASYFFGSKDRLGQSHVGDRTPRRAELLSQLPGVQFIDARVAGSGRGSHFYFYSHPAVSSDLILLMRDNRGPGTENGRPLASEKGGLWRIDQDYPAPEQGKHR